jgi:HEAT repeat protein
MLEIHKQLEILMKQPIGEESAEALRHIGEAAVLPLIAVLSDPDMQIRRWAAFGLGRLADQRAFTPLITAIHDSEWQVRMHVASALGWFGDPNAIIHLSTLLHDDNVNVRGNAS